MTESGRRWIWRVVIAALLTLASALAFLGCASLPPSTSLTVARGLVLQHQGGLYTPQSWTIVGDSLRPVLQRVERWAQTQGYTVIHKRLSTHGLHGRAYTDPVIEAVIVLSDDDAPNMQLHTLFHELAHVAQPKGLPILEREAFAEIVAVQVMGRLGVDSRRETVSYLAERVEDDRLIGLAMRHGLAMDLLVARFTAAAGGAS